MMDGRARVRRGELSLSLWMCLLAGGYASAAPAAAQTPPSVCPDGRIAEIVIDNHSVFDLTNPSRAGRFAWAYELANTLHFRTRTEVIERELLFAPGDCYDIEVLRDTERLLRAFLFLADADIFGIRLPSGDVQVIVDTQDEWSTRVEPRVGSNGSTGLIGLRLVEDNLIGSGRHLSLFYDRSDEERIYGVAYSTPHLFRSRWNMGLRVARTEVGESYSEAVTFPFVGETGRLAFRQGFSSDERFFELFMAESDDGLASVRVPVRRDQFELGGAMRWGSERYRHTILGGAFAVERIDYPAAPAFAEPDGRAPVTLAALDNEWSPVSSVRLMLLAGQSNVYYLRRRGLDTVNGTEDIRLGMEAEVSLGPTLPGISDDRDVAVGIGFFAAGEVATASLVGGRLSLEGRRAYEVVPGLPEWHDVFAELHAWGYLRRNQESRQLLVAALSAVGGWHGRVPFQLTLGGDAGLRGYPRHVDPGGRRVVGSLEYRANPLWPMPDLFDFGTVAFVDVGKIWPGHAPFGIESPVRASAGVGFRVAFPPGSRQTFRLDIGMPLQSQVAFDDLTFTIGIGQAIGRARARRDPQILRSARYGISTTDFIFP